MKQSSSKTCNCAHQWSRKRSCAPVHRRFIPFRISDPRRWRFSPVNFRKRDLRPTCRVSSQIKIENRPLQQHRTEPRRSRGPPRYLKRDPTVGVMCPARSSNPGRTSPRRARSSARTRKRRSDGGGRRRDGRGRGSCAARRVRRISPVRDREGVIAESGAPAKANRTTNADFHAIKHETTQ